jgi:hypothetical protein
MIIRNQILRNIIGWLMMPFSIYELRRKSLDELEKINKYITDKIYIIAPERSSESSFRYYHRQLKWQIEKLKK